MDFRERYITITRSNKSEVLKTLEALKCYKFSVVDGKIKPTEIEDDYFEEIGNVVRCYITPTKRILLLQDKDYKLGYSEIDLWELKSYKFESSTYDK